MGTDFGSVGTHPFPELRKIPSSGRPEVAKISDKDSQILRVLLPGQPEIHPLFSFLKVKSHISIVVKVRVLFQNSCGENCHPDSILLTFLV